MPKAPLPGRFWSRTFDGPRPISDQEYQEVCLSPADTEVEIALGTLAQYYCDRQPQHWNDKVADAQSIEDCALACTGIETCKGTFWKSKDGTCWWSDQDLLVESDGEPSSCTVVPGSVYMTVRKGHPDGCAVDLAECRRKTRTLEDEIEDWKKKDRDSATQISDLTKQIKDLEEKIYQASTCPVHGRDWAVYQQKEPSTGYGGRNEIIRKKAMSAFLAIVFFIPMP
ncbi:hypothetical protein BDV41DRAFT_581138 [Aspergillus transmontanensis]|uniref:Uncharacterized protein n=1 Tax=Aspergillus transmontanensis TaxID=1034304 RepID=A0A5N6VJW5_9EURO|nr:hypothetical protein BDV41DRAFT_581138 [Aspergillus transmontanensis]